MRLSIQRWAVLSIIGTTAALGPLPPDTGKPSFQMKEGITVVLTPVASAEASLKLRAVVRNGGNQAIWVMTDPIRSNGSKGPYLEFIRSTSELQISFLTFPPPQYLIYVDYAAVNLKLLKPNDELTQEVELPFPVKQTVPSYGDSTAKPEIQATDIKAIRAVVGILRDDESLRLLLEKKAKPGWINGSDIVAVGANKGKAIWQIQTCLYSNTLSFPKWEKGDSLN